MILTIHTNLPINLKPSCVHNFHHNLCSIKIDSVNPILYYKFITVIIIIKSNVFVYHSFITVDDTSHVMDQTQKQVDFEKPGISFCDVYQSSI